MRATNILIFLHRPIAFYWSVVALMLFISLLSIGLFSTPANAAQTIPYKVNFQGRLTDSTGNIKPDGLYNIKFRLMSAASGGTNLWQADRIYTGSGTDDHRVQVTNGLFSIQLGDTAVGVGDPALSPSLFNTATNPTVYLEVELPTPATASCATVSCGVFTEGAMTPRSLLGSAAYAFNADTVDGIDGSSLARVDTGNTFANSNSFNSGTTNTFNGNLVVNNTGTLTNNSVLGLNIGGTVGAYTLQGSGTGGYLYTDGSNVHIGITASGSAGASTSPTTTSNDTGLISRDGNYGAAINTGLSWGSNMAPNPGFEHGCAVWTNCNVETTNVNSGNGASRITTSVGSPVKLTTSSGAIAVRPGDTYYLSGFGKASAANIGTLKIGFDQYDKNNAFISTTSINIPNYTTFTQFEVTSSFASNATYVKPNITTNGDGAAGGNWYVDDLLLLHQDQPMQPIFKSPVDVTTAFQIQNAAGTALFVADATNKVIKIGGGDVSPDASPTLLVVDYKNTSGDPTGTNGGMYYNSSSNKFRCYEDSAWRDCINDTKTRLNYSNEFLGFNPNAAWGNNTNVDTTLVSGASNATFSLTAGEVNHPGIVRMTPTYNFANAIIALATHYSTSNTVKFGGGAWQMGTVFRPNIISSATNNYTFLFGFTDNNSSLSPNNGCYLNYNYNINSGNWQGTCKSGGSTTSCNTTVSGASTISSWTNLKVIVNAAGTSANFSVNGTTCSTPITTNIPTNGVSPLIGVLETAGSSNHDIDYLEIISDGLVR